MGPEVYSWYAGAQAAICVWSLWLWRTRSAPGAAELAVVAACLTYDNAILATGHLLGRGALLETLSQFRYGGYQIVGALIIVAVMKIVAAAGVTSLRSGALRSSIWMLALGLLSLAAWSVIQRPVLAPSCLDGLVRYTTHVPATQLCFDGQPPLLNPAVPLSAVVSHTLTMVLGAVVWGKQRWPWLMVCSIPIFIAAKIPTDQYAAGFLNAGVVVWIVALAASSQRFAVPTPGETEVSSLKTGAFDTAVFVARVSPRQKSEAPNRSSSLNGI